MLFIEAFIIAEALPIDFFFDDWQVFLWTVSTHYMLMFASIAVLLLKNGASTFPYVAVISLFVFIKIGLMVMSGFEGFIPGGVITALNSLQLPCVVYVIIFYFLSTVIIRGNKEKAHKDKQKT